MIKTKETKFMGKLTDITLRALSCALIMSGALLAEEAPKQENENVKPGSRPMAHTEWLKIQTERQEQEELGAEDPDATPEESAANAIAQDGGLQAKLQKNGFNASTKFAKPEAKTHYTTHQGAFFNPVAIHPLGETVEFHDGSVWTIASGDTYKTLNWLTSDLLVVTGNHSWFSSYMFRITNQNTGVSVKANMLLGPIYNGLFTYWIVSINHYTGELCLNDGSVWKLSGLDASTHNKWFINDTIVIGINDGFFSSSKPNILINVNTLSYSRAKCVW